MSLKQQQGPPTLKPPRREPFESPVENPALIVPEDGNVATGWTPWAAEDRGFRVPEFIAVELDGRRVQGISAEHRYEACLMQQVKITPHLALRFTMNFRVTPNHDTDQEWPEGIVVGVGIDPCGGNDPRGDAVQWALRDLRYFQEVQASIIAVPQTEVVTVFVRSIAFIPGSTTAAGNGSGPQCAITWFREAYPRTYVLLYPGASEAVWVRAAKFACANHYTLGGSADDAGLGSDILANATVIAIGPTQWDPDLTQQWFRQWYPPGAAFIVMTEGQLPQ